MAGFYGMGTSAVVVNSFQDIRKTKKLIVFSAADQALSFEVLTASGEFLTADAVSNPDLYWALKGGGPSTFGIVLSITTKTFPEVPSASIILNINSTHTNDTSLFYKGVAALHDLSNHWVDHGMFVFYELWTGRFHVQPILGPNMTAAQITEVAKPMFDRLDADGVPYSTSTKEFPTFFDLYIDIFEDETAGSSGLIGGRLFTKRDIAEHAADIIEAHRTTVESGTSIYGHIVGPGYGAPRVDNAIHPKWREASSFPLTFYSIAGNAPLEEKAQAQNLVTNIVGDALRRAGPYGAAYVNEVSCCSLWVCMGAHTFDSEHRAILKSPTGRMPIGAQTTLVCTSSRRSGIRMAYFMLEELQEQRIGK